MLKRGLLFVFLLYSVNLFAQKNSVSVVSLSSDSLETATRIDSSKIKERAFSEKTIQQYKSNPEFNYSEDTDEENLNWWDRFWRWFWNFIRNLLGSKTENESSSFPPWLNYLLLLIVVAGVVYIVVKLLGKDLMNIFSKKSAVIDIPYTESLENIHEISFDEELEKALDKKDYRLAVRLLFLNSLKQLSDANIIQWRLEKTNTAYLKEIKEKELAELFVVLTRQFEYVWYGDFHVNKQSFENIRTLFLNLKTRLS